MHKKYNTFWFVVIIECIAIGAIALVFFVRQQHIYQINPLSKTSIQRKQNSQFQYYYEFPSNTKNYGKATWLRNEVTYQFNADGLHERFDYEINKELNVYRIITLGDSFTYGMWVNTKDNFSEVLEDLLNNSVLCQHIEKFEVINLGAPGFDLRYSLKRFEDKGAKYSPDLVIWFIRGENLVLDMEQYRVREEYYKKKIDEQSINKTDNQYQASMLAYKDNMNTYENLSPEEQKEMIHSHTASISRLSSEFHIPILILTRDEESSEDRVIMKSYASNENNIWYDEVSAVNTFHPDDYHPNEGGHRYIAVESVNFLLKNLLTTCKTNNLHENIQ